MTTALVGRSSHSFLRGYRYIIVVFFLFRFAANTGAGSWNIPWHTPAGDFFQFSFGELHLLLFFDILNIVLSHRYCLLLSAALEPRSFS